MEYQFRRRRSSLRDQRSRGHHAKVSSPVNGSESSAKAGLDLRTILLSSLGRVSRLITSMQKHLSIVRRLWPQRRCPRHPVANQTHDGGALCHQSLREPTAHQSRAARHERRAIAPEGAHVHTFHGARSVSQRLSSSACRAACPCTARSCRACTRIELADPRDSARGRRPASRLHFSVEVIENAGLEHQEAAVDPALADLRLLGEVRDQVAVEHQPAEARRRAHGRHRRELAVRLDGISAARRDRCRTRRRRRSP